MNPGRHAHLGVSFDYPEDQVTGLTWLGRGPHRVWKNRIQGTAFDLSESVGEHPTQLMGAYSARLFFYFGSAASTSPSR